MTKFEKPDGFTFSIIRHRNSPNDAETDEGVKVTRQTSLFVPSYEKTFMCAPYTDHFIYRDPSKKVGRWTLMCTCGSAAGIVGYDAYKQDASPQGAMIVCLIHAQFGSHQDGTKG